MMIDIENKVIDIIQTAFTTAGTNVNIVSAFVEAPSSFPCVAIYEMNNATYKKSLDTSLTEHHAQISYQVEIFSNKKTSPKAEIKSIQQIIDSTMQNMKFVRESFSFVPDSDRSISRGVARYSAVVGEGITTNNITTHQMYRV